MFSGFLLHDFIFSGFLFDDCLPAVSFTQGHGGLDDPGATFWGQTELSCFDNSMHGIWGMSYKYNEKAMVLNHKNLIRLWDVAYDGYNGGRTARTSTGATGIHIKSSAKIPTRSTSSTKEPA